VTDGPPDAAQTIEFLRRLNATRLFRPDAVPQRVLDDILKVARWSGSASNKQPWEFVVVHDRQMLQALGADNVGTPHIAVATLAIVLVTAGDTAQLEQEIFDEGRLAERIMLAAAAHGVGSCIGWFRGDSGAIAGRKLLGIPAARRLRTVISLGYPAENWQRTRQKPLHARKPLAELVHQERYS